MITTFPNDIMFIINPLQCNVTDFRPVDVNQTFFASVQTTPTKTGKMSIVATFNAAELLGVVGSCEVEVI